MQKDFTAEYAEAATGNFAGHDMCIPDEQRRLVWGTPGKNRLSGFSIHGFIRQAVGVGVTFAADVVNAEPFKTFRQQLGFVI